MPETDAHKAFTKNIARPNALQAMFDAGTIKPTKSDRRAAGKPTKEENELLRASVIMAIGALDAYLSDVAAEVLVAQLQGTQPRSDGARQLLRRIMKEVDTLPLELALLPSAADREQVISAVLQDHLSNKVSNHGAKGVAATVERMGRRMDWTNLDSKVPLFLPFANDAKGAAGALDAWTLRRHQLVHQGKAIRVSSIKAKSLSVFIRAIARDVDDHAQAAIAAA